jgi:hypothetical protein
MNGLEEDKYPDAKYFVIDKLRQKNSEEIQPKDGVVWFWTYWSFISQRINV